LFSNISVFNTKQTIISVYCFFRVMFFSPYYVLFSFAFILICPLIKEKTWIGQELWWHNISDRIIFIKSNKSIWNIFKKLKTFIYKFENYVSLYRNKSYWLFPQDNATKKILFYCSSVIVSTCLFLLNSETSIHLSNLVSEILSSLRNPRISENNNWKICITMKQLINYYLWINRHLIHVCLMWFYYLTFLFWKYSILQCYCSFAFSFHYRLHLSIFI
jgi:hypothetical protein